MASLCCVKFWQSVKGFQSPNERFVGVLFDSKGNRTNLNLNRHVAAVGAAVAAAAAYLWGCVMLPGYQEARSPR